MSDDYRFADEVAKRSNKELGAYGGDVVPGIMTRTITGVARGEELFSRPELHRPWRTPTTQRHAEVVVAKEQEIEVLTRKLTELRSQVATGNREIQRIQSSNKIQLKTELDAKDKIIVDLKDKIELAARDLVETKANYESQIKALKSQQDIDMGKVQSKLKQASDSAGELSAVYTKQIDDIKAAAAREVDLIQRLCNSRTAELSDELKISNEALRKCQERHLVSIGELQAEMRRNESRVMEQLREQEKRFEAMRTSLQSERQTVEFQRDKVSTEKADSQDRLRSTGEDLKITEQRFRDWNSRILSDLDQIFEYYSAMIREVEKESPLPSTDVLPQQRVTDVYIPPRLSSEPVTRVSMDRIIERLFQLTLMKQSHSSASQSLLRKIRNMEVDFASKSEATHRTADEKELQLTRLLTEVVESRGRQERLEKAIAESQVQFADLESRLSAATIRLQFFNDDLASALSSPAATVAPPTKDVTFVLVAVEGGNILWESDPQAASTSLMMMNNAIRAKMAQYGAYECFSDGTTMMLAFHDPIAACRFALESQLWLMELPWPASITAHYNTCDTFHEDEKGNRFLIFRGLRAAMAIHSGDVEMEPTGLPVGVGESRVHYFGRTVIQSLHLASMAVGGQIVVSNQVWQRVKTRSDDLGKPAVTDLGDHRLTVALRGGSDGPTTSEVITLVQLQPAQLAARKFDRQSMFDARKHLHVADSTGITPQLSHIRRSTLTDEVTSLRSRQAVVTKAMETLQDESSAVGTNLDALVVKIRDARAGTHIFNAADLQTQATTVDRLVSKLDVVKSDLGRALTSNEDLRQKCKSLEDTLALHSRVTMSEDDFRRRIEIANERCNQQVFEANQQSESKLQQLRQALAQFEQQNTELRRQLHGPSHLQPLGEHPTQSLAQSGRATSTTKRTASTKPVRTASSATESRSGNSPTFPDKLKKTVSTGRNH